MCVSQIIFYIRQKNVPVKNAFLIILLTFSTIVSATDYYVSSSGNDTNNGLSSSSPWKTIAKVNSAFSTLKPGDRVLFNRGNTFYGTLKITKSGSAASPIIIGSYGTGEKPIITGFTAISAWTDEGNGIYSKAIGCESSTEMVTVNGTQYGMGRYPNAGKWLTVDSHSGDVSITDADLNASVINWTNAEIVQRKPNLFTIDRNKITKHTNQTLIYNGNGDKPPSDKYGYFIQNDIKTLDSFGEWYYNTGTSTFYMYFGTSNPTDYVVQISSITDLVIFTSGANYITFDNFSFKGANHNALYLTSNNYITLQNCNIDFSGNNGIRGYVAEHFTAINNNINHSNNIGIFLNGWYVHYASISKNTIKNSGLIPGHVQSVFGSGCGLFVAPGDYQIIENNQIYGSGYCGIAYGGNGSIIRNNFIDTFCTILEDGGGIYYGGQKESSNMVVTNNIVINGVGSVEGKPVGTALMAAGIYMDYYTTGGVKISNNTVANCSWIGLLISGSQNLEVTNNTVFNSKNCVQLQEIAGLGSPLRNITMNGNIFFAKDATQTPMFLQSTTNDFAQLGAFDNNYYARPLDNAKPIWPVINWSGTPKTLTEWQTLYGKDANSHISPIALKDTANIDFYYNSTNADKVITLDLPMIDVKGAKYVNSITLMPFTSVVLMVDPTPDQLVIPVYTSSVVENSTPLIIGMTYHVSLANIVPANTAFTVQVNGINSSVTSVAISGKIVQLTLASAVVFGDIVTVAYTKPASNPLQTALGGVAASISAKTVTNNCISVVPVYISSVVENATPAIIEMSYDLSLANIVPAASAFNVQVNSVARTVSSVAIVSGKVRLTLASAVVSGNTVTVTYTKPSSNPLQTASGEVAASIIAQPVINNCLDQSKPNDPPVLVINNEVDSCYSGFVYEIDASGSYDLNNDILIYEWTLPNNVASSSTNSSKIQFLAPIVSTSRNFEFQMRVNDGRAIVSKIIPIKIMPYKPELVAAKVINSEASDYQVPDYPNNVLDSNLSTKWSVNGDNQWLIVKLAKSFKISHLEIAFLQGQKYESYFDIYASIDNLNWDPILTNTSSCNFSGDIHVFEFPISKTNIEYTYIKLIGHGNALNRWNNFSEFKIFSLLEQNPGSGDTEKRKIIIYPNPAQDFFNISVEEPTVEPDIIQIIDFSGRIIFEDSFEQEIKNVQIPANLSSGIYIVELKSGTITLYSQKLIVNR